MIVDGKPNEPRYNVVVNGRVKKRSVPKRVAENYIINLDENLQSSATLVPVTDDGKEILLG